MKVTGGSFSTNSLDRYRNELATPEWSNFSSRIRKTRNYCECCRRQDVVLNVHHIFHDPERSLWEYEPEALIVLCEKCHRELHEQLKAFRKCVFRKLKPQCFRVLNGALAVALEQYDPLVFCHALAEFVSNPHLVQKYAEAWGMESKK